MSNLQQQWNDIATGVGLNDADKRAGLKIMQAESGCDASAKNPNGSACGLFQIIDGTWDTICDQHPDIDRNGRNDPKQQMLAGAYLIKSYREALGPNAGDGDIYLAHFLGVAGAKTALENPTSRVADIMPQIIGPNKGIRLKHDGQTKYIKDFTLADLRVWAATKMDADVDYNAINFADTGTDAEREEYRKKHPGMAYNGFDAFGDMQPMEQMFMMVIVGLLSNLFKGVSGGENVQSDAAFTPNPATAQPSTAAEATPVTLDPIDIKTPLTFTVPKVQIAQDTTPSATRS